MTLVTISINPYAWWARFVPQVALVPVLLTAAAGRRYGFGALGVLPFYLLNSMALFIPMLMDYRYETSHVHRQLKAVAERCGPGEYQVVGRREFNYDQFTELYGIHVRMPPDVPETTTPVNGMMPFRDVFLYKSGCNAE